MNTNIYICAFTNDMNKPRILLEFSNTAEAIIFASVRFNINIVNRLNNAKVVMPIILLYCKLRVV